MDPDFSAEVSEKKLIPGDGQSAREKLKGYLSDMKDESPEWGSKALIVGGALLGTYFLYRIVFFRPRGKKVKYVSGDTAMLPAKAEPEKENALLSIFKSIILSLVLTYAKRMLVKYIESLDDAGDENNEPGHRANP